MLKNGVFGLIISNMALTISFIFHMIVEDNETHYFRQIAIFRNFIKGIKDELAIFGVSTKRIIKLLLIVETSKADYLKVF